MIIANPADIIGPILSPHHANETWQGKIAHLVRGGDPVQEPGSARAGGRAWMTVDVRDCADAQIKLAESGSIPSGKITYCVGGQ